MLVLSRKKNERIVIGQNIVVQVIRVTGGAVRLGIEAPLEVSIRRDELPRLNEGGERRCEAARCA